MPGDKNARVRAVSKFSISWFLATKRGAAGLLLQALRTRLLSSRGRLADVSGSAGRSYESPVLPSTPGDDQQLVIVAKSVKEILDLLLSLLCLR